MTNNEKGQKDMEEEKHSKNGVIIRHLSHLADVHKYIKKMFFIKLIKKIFKIK